MSEPLLQQIFTGIIDSVRQLRVTWSSDAAAYESITVADSAIGLTSGTYGTSIYATISCEVAQVRFRVDGTNPTASEGHVLNPDDILMLDSNADIAAFKAIRKGGISGVLKVTYSGVA